MNKEQILALIHTEREDGADFTQEQQVFQWYYEEEPDVQITLYIGQHDEDFDFGIEH